MSNQDPPLHAFDAQQRLAEQNAPPTRCELWEQFLDGTLTLDQWADAMNAFYPLSDEDAARLLTSKRQPLSGLWDAIIERREGKQFDRRSIP